jgi:hypothetical protein
MSAKHEKLNNCVQNYSWKILNRINISGDVALRWESNIGMGVREIWPENVSWLKTGSCGRCL